MNKIFVFHLSVNSEKYVIKDKAELKRNYKTLRNMRRLFCVFLCGMFSLLALVSCEIYTPTGGVPEDAGMYMMCVRFENPSGSNAVDSIWGMNRLELFSDPMDSLSKNINDGMTVDARRESDNGLLKIRKKSVIVANGPYADKLESENETLLALDFSDPQMMYDKEYTGIKSQVYTLTFSDERLFGKGITHTIKFYLKISGRGLFSVTKCEVDDVEQSVDDIMVKNSVNFPEEPPYYFNYIMAAVRVKV